MTRLRLVLYFFLLLQRYVQVAASDSSRLSLVENYASELGDEQPLGADTKVGGDTLFEGNDPDEAADSEDEHPSPAVPASRVGSLSPDVTPDKDGDDRSSEIDFSDTRGEKDGNIAEVPSEAVSSPPETRVGSPDRDVATRGEDNNTAVESADEISTSHHEDGSNDVRIPSKVSSAAESSRAKNNGKGRKDGIETAIAPVGMPQTVANDSHASFAEVEEDDYEIPASYTAGELPVMGSRAYKVGEGNLMKVGGKHVHQVLMVVVTVPRIKPKEFRSRWMNKYADLLSSQLGQTLGMDVKVRVTGLQGEDSGSGVFTQIMFGEEMNELRLRRFVDGVVKKDFGPMFNGLFGRVRRMLQPTARMIL